MSLPLFGNNILYLSLLATKKGVLAFIKQTSPLDRLSKHTSAQEQTGRSTELSSELEHAMLAASKQVMQRWWLKSIRE